MSRRSCGLPSLAAARAGYHVVASDFDPEVMAILRRDTQEWALPGGMVAQVHASLTCTRWRQCSGPAYLIVGAMRQ